MMKRILSLLLALLMLASMVPGGVFATDETVPETVEEMVEETTEAVTEPTEVPAEVPTEAPTEAATLPTEAVLEAAMLEEELVEEIVEETVEGTVGDIMPESTVPAIVSNDFCPWCEETLAEDGSVIHAVNCKAAFAYDGSADVGRFVRLVAVDEEYSVDVSGDPVNEESLIFYFYEFGEDIVMRVTDWYWDAESTELWYRVELFRGAFPEGTEDYPWPETPWILQCYTDPVADYPPVLEFVNICEVCGKENCEVSHFTCEICGNVRCDLPHPYCNLCNVFDCTQTHTWCGTCGCYDCVLEHGEPYRPMLEPVIPENPVLTEGAAVSITDETGNPVTESGIFLEAGTHSSISAWGETEEASFQWQIRYDSANDSWINIRGQNGRGIVLSPAMFMSLLESQGSAAVRCIMSTGGQSMISDPIPVGLLAETEAVSVSSAAAHASAEVMLADTDAPDGQEGQGTDQPQQNHLLIIEFVYEDGRTAAATKQGDLPYGKAYSDTFDLPTIAGYKSVLKDGSAYVTIEGQKLKVDFPEGVLVGEHTALKVTYEPDYVDYTVVHFKQNIYDDEYVEALRETVKKEDAKDEEYGIRYFKTGDEIKGVEKTGGDFEGFYSLKYIAPKAAADGSTVIYIYYDRYYYLIQFDLSGGFGADPVFDRYGAAVPLYDLYPTLAGYDFGGWLDESGKEVSLPDTMPADNLTFKAKWIPHQAKYTIAYWTVNDDGTRTLLGTRLARGAVDSTVTVRHDLGYTDINGDPVDKRGVICNEETDHVHGDDCYACDLVNHRHNSGCFTNFQLADVENPGDNGLAAIKTIGINEPQSGYIYAIEVGDGNWWPKLYLDGKWYVVNGIGSQQPDGSWKAGTWDQVQSIIDGEPIGNTGQYQPANDGLHKATKYKPKTACQTTQHNHAETSCTLNCTAHVHDKTCYQDTTYLVPVSSVTVPPAGEKQITYTSDTSITISGDGRSIANVYYQYKQYTLKFYYAATTGGTATDADKNPETYDTIKILGGTSYWFGSWGTDTDEDETLLEGIYWGKSDQWGEVDELPTLNEKGDGIDYTKSSVSFDYSYYVEGVQVTTTVTYHYISFNARFGDDISGLWPCAVFNTVTRKNKNDYTWPGEEAFVSAWNGEHHVKYSQDNANQTIKGIYDRLDEELLFKSNYADSLTVSYICFWENGSDVGWNVPELYRYNIYLQAYSGQDLSGKTTIIRQTETGERITYYLAKTIDTCDDSFVDAQTQGAMMGYKRVSYEDPHDNNHITVKSKANYNDYEGEDNEKKEFYFEYKTLIKTNQDAILNDPNRKQDYFDGRLYNEGYSLNFYYNANQHNLTFWNHDGFLREGGGSVVAYQEPLRKYILGISNPQNDDQRGASWLAEKKPPESLEPGAYRFEAWYTSANFEADTRVDPETFTMPDEKVILYAHWVPVERTVKFYMTKDSMRQDKTIPQEMEELWEKTFNADYPNDSPYNIFSDRILNHGQFLGSINDPGVAKEQNEEYAKIHPRNGYIFVNWFYEDEQGREYAFDPQQVPVKQDLKLYAKWTSADPYPYTVYFLRDENRDGVADRDEQGNYIYVAAPLTGSSLAGRSLTFEAKGDYELNSQYRDRYFPTVSSHSLLIEIPKTESQKNEYAFLYQPVESVRYIVRYRDENGNLLRDENGQQLKDENGNPLPDDEEKVTERIVVTEYFKFIEGYMPDAYQKTMKVSLHGENIIEFRYKKDTQHAVYAINHYVQELERNTDGELVHKNWKLEQDFQDTGVIGQPYTAEAMSFTGFTLSKVYTDQYNVTDEINGYDGTALPTKGTSGISALTEAGKLTGTLSKKGLELNFYYTRNTYPFEFRYKLNGTDIPLKDPDTGMGAYDTDETKTAGDINVDLDGDGEPENFRLYDPVDNQKTIHILVDESPPKINVETFYYVRTTRDMTITKYLPPAEGMDPDQEFTICLKIHAKDGYNRSSYQYTKKNKDGSTATGTVERLTTDNTLLLFKLKGGESITIYGLPTAKYTVSERDMPLGYYAKNAPQQYILSVEDIPEDQEDKSLHILVENEYQPAALEISKEVVEPVVNGDPAVTEFEFKIEVPEGVTGTFAYIHYDGNSSIEKTASVSDGVMSIELKKGERAAFENLPEGSYEVTEEDYTVDGYSTLVYINGSANGQEKPATVILKRNETNTVVFRNSFLTGNLTIDRKKAADNNQVFVYNVYKTHNQESVLVCAVTVTGNSSTTIHYLPVGEYNVVEMESWSWRYPNPQTEQVIIEENQTASVEFSQIRGKNNWLDGLSRVEVNTWGEAKQ